MLDAAQHLAAIGGDDRGSVAFQRMAEGIVGGQEEPAVAAGLGQRLAGAVGQHVGIVGVGDRVRRAGLAGEVGRGSARIEQHRVLLLDEIIHRECHAGIRGIGDRIDLVVVDPGPRDVDADVGLVLVIAAHDVDLPALLEQAGILDRHLDRDHRIGAADVGVKARHVVQHADLDGLVLRKCGRGEAYAGNGDQRGETPRAKCGHVFPPSVVAGRPSRWRRGPAFDWRGVSRCGCPRQCAYRSASEVSLNFCTRFPVSTSAV